MPPTVFASPPGKWDALLTLAEDMVRLSLSHMTAATTQGDANQALQWAQTTAGFIAHGGTFGRLASVEIEQTALSVARTLPVPPFERSPGPPRRFLHVLTEGFALFGHTKLCRKWIELAPSPARHDVVLLDQYGPPPTALRQTVEARQGRLTVLDRTLPMTMRAQQLRELAWADADVVVLHVHPNDVIPSVAFGVTGGPRVLYMNHADHEFWIGGAVADLVLDTRESGQSWTRQYRGITRTQLLPIPLDEAPAWRIAPEQLERLRRETRAQWQIGNGEFLFLTIGSANKYVPVTGLSFLEAAEAILQRCPQARLLAVGPTLTGPWAQASQRTQGRLMAIGTQTDLDRFHAAADLYLEGMPAGSLTSLLEACLSGLACVRAPQQSRPPHASDGIALDFVAQPNDLSAYVDEAVALAHDDSARHQLGAALRQRALDTHCGTAWTRRLSEVLSQVPPSHAVYPDQQPSPVERSEIDIKLAYTYPVAARALADMQAAFLLQAVHNSRTARRQVECALPAALHGATGGRVDIYPLLRAVLPELPLAPVADAGPVDIVPLARWLLRRAAEEGRRWTALTLAVRLTLRLPGLWRTADFGKGLLAFLSRS